ncbi:MAG: hypothetical protein WBO84_03605 [Acidimicrobiia bacterium]
MIETTATPAMTDTELEAWLSEAGIAASVVERCPVPTCSSCARPSDQTLPHAA